MTYDNGIINPIDSPGKPNVSQADKSNINNLQEDNSKLREIAEQLGVTTLRQDMDVVMQKIDAIAIKMSELITSQQEVIKKINSGVKQDNNDGLDKIEKVAEIVDKLGIFKKESTNVAPIFDDEWIRNKMKSSLEDNFSLGEQLTSSLKNSLKSSATKSIIKKAITHEPE